MFKQNKNEVRKRGGGGQRELGRKLGLLCSQDICTIHIHCETEKMWLSCLDIT